MRIFGKAIQKSSWVPLIHSDKTINDHQKNCKDFIGWLHHVSPDGKPVKPKFYGFGHIFAGYILPADILPNELFRLVDGPVQ